MSLLLTCVRIVDGHSRCLAESFSLTRPALERSLSYLAAEKEIAVLAIIDF